MPEPEEPKTEDVVLDYAAVVAVLDQNGDLEAVIDKILCEGVSGRLDEEQAREDVGAFLMRLREVLRMRGWGPPPKAAITFKGQISQWAPRVTPDVRLMRITFDARGVESAAIPALWDVQNKTCQATFLVRDYQPSLMPAAAASAVGDLMAAHEGGQHKTPDWACPNCLMEGAARRLEAQEELNEEPESPDAYPAAELDAEADPE